MDKDSVQKMGMTPADVTAMIAAWQNNQQLWRDKLVANKKFEWGLFYGGQQTAPGENQTCGQCTCQSYLQAQCGPHSGTQNGTLFYGYSRTTHQQPWPLPTPDSDLAMFLLSRGDYAFFGCVRRVRQGKPRAGCWLLRCLAGSYHAVTHAHTRTHCTPPLCYTPLSPQLWLERLHLSHAPLYAPRESGQGLWHAPQLLQRDVPREPGVDAQLHQAGPCN